MTPSKLALVIKCATAIAQHRGRTVPAIRSDGPWDGRACVAPDADGWTEYAIADPPEYPVLVFSDPPDTSDVPLEEYPAEPVPFERDEIWWRREKGC